MVAETLTAVSENHKTISRIYVGVGEREHLMKRLSNIPILWVAMVVLLVGVSPIMAQDVIAPAVDAATRPDWLELALVLVLGGGVIGAMTLAYKAIGGLRDSFPPGTAESWERLWQQVSDKATSTPNTYDDMIVGIAGPLAEALLKLLKASEGTTTPPPSSDPPAL